MIIASKPVQSSGRDGQNPLLNGFLSLADAWIARMTDEPRLTWFQRALAEIAERSTEAVVATNIALAPRRLGKADLSLNANDRALATDLRPGLDPTDWSVDQLARIAFMAASHTGDDVAFALRLDSFCTTAEVNELVAVCRGLPIYPAPALLEARAREAVRSGIKPVFEAVAHRNPYPGEVFSEDAWNQMVVKALFIGSSLWPIQGLDARGNPRLARMLVDLAHERWSAGRPVSGELWRCVAPHADQEGIAALTHVLETGTDTERLAVALALQPVSAHPLKDIGERSDAVLRTAMVKDLEARVANERIDWRHFG
jgi:hypothetical protein